MSENTLQLHPRISALKPEEAFIYLVKAKELEKAGKKVISFGIGQPDFDTPDHIKKAAFKALKEGFTGYVDAQGIKELREAIAEYTNEFTGSDVKPEEVIVLPGTKPGIYFSIMGFIGPGDEVLVPDPGFPCYESIVRYSGAKPVFLTLKEANQFSLKPEQVEEAITSKTKMLILNNPHNPTGSVIEPRDLEEILEIARENKLIVVADEIYDRYVYEGEFKSAISDPDWRDYMIYVNGFSKTFSMTGWRLGYAIARKDVIERLTLLALNLHSCVTSFVQKAGIAALKGPWDVIEERLREFKKRRDEITKRLKSIPGVKVVPPKGTFYIFPNFKEVIEKTGWSTSEFVVKMMEDTGVVTLPGTAFPLRGGDGYLRLSFARSIEDIIEGTEKMKEYVVSLIEKCRD